MQFVHFRVGFVIQDVKETDESLSNVIWQRSRQKNNFSQHIIIFRNFFSTSSSRRPTNSKNKIVRVISVEKRKTLFFFFAKINEHSRIWLFFA